MIQGSGLFEVEPRMGRVFKTLYQIEDIISLTEFTGIASSMSEDLWHLCECSDASTSATETSTLTPLFTTQICTPLSATARHHATAATPPCRISPSAASHNTPQNRDTRPPRHMPQPRISSSIPLFLVTSSELLGIVIFLPRSHIVVFVMMMSEPEINMEALIIPWFLGIATLYQMEFHQLRQQHLYSVQESCCVFIFIFLFFCG